jgi:hypothetical protein
LGNEGKRLNKAKALFLRGKARETADEAAPRASSWPYSLALTRYDGIVGEMMEKD